MIGRTGVEGGQQTKVNLDFGANDSGRQRTSEGEDEVLQFAQEVYTTQ